MSAFVILSAESHKLSRIINANRTDSLKSMLQGYGFSFETAQGCYRRTKEASFKVPVNSVHDVNKLVEFAYGFGQESILFVNDQGNAALFYCDTKRMEPLGKWSEVDSVVNFEAYSIVNNRYFVCK